MEDRFTEMIHYFEGSQSRTCEKQNKKLEDCAKGQNDLKAMLMSEVENISVKVIGENKENVLNQSSKHRERAMIDQLRQTEGDY